jgi:hypothetical protein
VLSNDNGFLNYGDNHDHAFTQRTLVSRFDMNLTHTVEVVRKPVINVMLLLSLLGDRISRSVQGAGDPMTSTVGVLPTLRFGAATNELAILVYGSMDSSNSTGNVSVQLSLTNLPDLGSSVAIAMDLLDNSHGNAYGTWQAQGEPLYPTAAQFAAMRASMEIPQLPGYPQQVAQLPTQFALTVPVPGVVLLHACARPASGPGAVTNVRLHVTPTVAPPEVLVMWEEPAGERCLLTYRLYWLAAAGEPQNVITRNTTVTVFVHA